MSDVAQVLLFIVILILAVIFIIIGIQIIFILKDVKQSVLKTNKVLDNTGEITESIKNPLNSISSLLMGLKAGASIFNIVKKAEDEKEKKDGK